MHIFITKYKYIPAWLIKDSYYHVLYDPHKILIEDSVLWIPVFNVENRGATIQNDFELLMKELKQQVFKP